MSSSSGGKWDLYFLKALFQIIPAIHFLYILGSCALWTMYMFNVDYRNLYKMIDVLIDKMVISQLINNRNMIRYYVWIVRYLGRRALRKIENIYLKVVKLVYNKYIFEIISRSIHTNMLRIVIKFLDLSSNMTTLSMTGKTDTQTNMKTLSMTGKTDT